MKRRREGNFYPRRVWGFCTHSRKYWPDDLSLCWQKRQQDSADYKEYDHIRKVPVDAVFPGFHGLNCHYCAVGDVRPSG